MLSDIATSRILLRMHSFTYTLPVPLAHCNKLGRHWLIIQQNNKTAMKSNNCFGWLRGLSLILRNR